MLTKFFHSFSGETTANKDGVIQGKCLPSFNIPLITIISF